MYKQKLPLKTGETDNMTLLEMSPHVPQIHITAHFHTHNEKPDLLSRNETN